MDNITKAKINLFAVLRNLEDLCAMDKASADIIKDTKLSVQFNVPDVGSATIDFDHGKCTFNRGKNTPDCNSSSLRRSISTTLSIRPRMLTVNPRRSYLFSTTYSK